MKINVDVTLKTFDGKPMMDADSNGNAVEATVKTVLVNAILVPGKEDKGVDKVRKYELAKMIFKGGEVDLTPEDIVLIKQQVGDNFAPVVVGQIFEMLSNDPHQYPYKT